MAQGNGMNLEEIEGPCVRWASYRPRPGPCGSRHSVLAAHRRTRWTPATQGPAEVADFLSSWAKRHLGGDDDRVWSPNELRQIARSTTRCT